MKLISNIIWILTGGLSAAILFFCLGLFLCLSIVGIPLGVQCIKMVELVLAPFGKKVTLRFGSHPIANVLWFIIGGFAIGGACFFAGLLLCVTVIGFPFGLQFFKLAKLAAFPFGAEVS